jgi:CDP-4-dehydro-6-deoxyglucose reductase
MGKDVYRVKLASEALSQVRYLGGQYLTLLSQGGHWIPFSIGNAPEEHSHLELHIRLIPGHALAEQILNRLRKTRKAHIQLPLGKCVLRDGERPVVFIVGGTGFSPVKAMLESAFAKQDTRQFHLFWGAQTQQDLYLKELVDGWQQQRDNFHFTPVVSGEDVHWQGARGLVHFEAIRQLSNLSQYDFYISGSEAMVLAVYYDLLENGADKSQIYSDMLDIKRDMGEDI